MTIRAIEPLVEKLVGGGEVHIAAANIASVRSHGNAVSVTLNSGETFQVIDEQRVTPDGSSRWGAAERLTAATQANANQVDSRRTDKPREFNVNEEIGRLADYAKLLRKRVPQDCLAAVADQYRQLAGMFK